MNLRETMIKDKFELAVWHILPKEQLTIYFQMVRQDVDRILSEFRLAKL